MRVHTNLGLGLLCLALAIMVGGALGDLSRSGGGGHALQFRDHGVLIENFRDLGECLPGVKCSQEFRVDAQLSAVPRPSYHSSPRVSFAFVSPSETK